MRFIEELAPERGAALIGSTRIGGAHLGRRLGPTKSSVTTRLYYEDSYLTSFDAAVLRVASHGDRQAVWLDRSAFYPTTGGQPFDTGTLDAAHVVDVVEDDNGDVLHLLEGEPLRVGQAVRGVVDWTRRFDHMQQHSGQHVLSAAIARLFGVPTVSFHLGAEASTIDLARELSAGEIDRAEIEANRVVWDDRPVTVRYASAAEAGALALRKLSARAGTLRLVDIEDADLSACGGTHVRRTGAIGVVVVSAWERFKGGHRLEFHCGSRALTRFRSLRDIVASSDRLLSVTPPELPAAIERLQEQGRTHKRAMAALQTELSTFRAAALAAAAEPGVKARLVLQAIEADASGLKALASAVSVHAGLAVLLVSRATPSLIVVARSAGVDVSARQVLSALTVRFGGRGGGSDDLAQGGGLDAAPEAILAEARRLLN
jgi:alanyl-tRNA synthetase